MRRPKGTGCYRGNANGTWTFIIFKNGRKKEFSERNRTAAHAKYIAWKEAGGWTALDLPRSQSTVGDYLDKWWAEAIPNWAPTTRQTNEFTFNKWLCEDDLRALPWPPSVEDIKAFLARMPENTSANTKYRVSKLLKSALQCAVDDHQIPYNPASYKNAPRKPKADVVEAFLPEHETQLIQYVADKLDWRALCLLAFDSGAREAELLALTEASFNFSTGHVHIQKTVDTLAGVPTLKDFGKTLAARRSIQLAPTTLAAVQSLLASITGPYLFTEEGRLWDRHRFYSAWRRLLAAAGIPNYHFHATRHTCATRLLRAGAYLPAVAARLGHAKASVTLDVYADAIPRDQTALACAYETHLATIDLNPNITPEVNPTLPNDEGPGPILPAPQASASTNSATRARRGIPALRETTAPACSTLHRTAPRDTR